MPEPSECEKQCSNYPTPKDLGEYLRWYDQFRSYVQHEDSLVHNRLQWILTIHGFLYATYGFTLQKQLETVASISSVRPDRATMPALEGVYTQTFYFTFMIAAVGAAISLAGLISIVAANRSVRRVARLFRSQNKTMIFDSNKTIQCQDNRIVGLDERTSTLRYGFEEFSFPTIDGGGERRIARYGNVASVSIPILLLMSWIFALFFNFHLGGEYSTLFDGIAVGANNCIVSVGFPDYAGCRQ